MPINRTEFSKPREVGDIYVEGLCTWAEFYHLANLADYYLSGQEPDWLIISTDETKYYGIEKKSRQSHYFTQTEADNKRFSLGPFSVVIIARRFFLEDTIFIEEDGKVIERTFGVGSDGENYFDEAQQLAKSLDNIEPGITQSKKIVDLAMQKLNVTSYQELWKELSEYYRHHFP